MTSWTELLKTSEPRARAATWITSHALSVKWTIILRIKYNMHTKVEREEYLLFDALTLAPDSDMIRRVVAHHLGMRAIPSLGSRFRIQARSHR